MSNSIGRRPLRSIRTAATVRTSDVTVAALRTLMTGYQLWGERNACDTGELSAMFHIGTSDLVDCLRVVAREGWVLIDDDLGTVSLTDVGARALAVRPGALDS